MNYDGSRRRKRLAPAIRENKPARAERGSAPAGSAAPLKARNGCSWRIAPFDDSRGVGRGWRMKCRAAPAALLWSLRSRLESNIWRMTS